MKTLIKLTFVLAMVVAMTNAAFASSSILDQAVEEDWTVAQLVDNKIRPLIDSFGEANFYKLASKEGYTREVIEALMSDSGVMNLKVLAVRKYLESGDLKGIRNLAHGGGSGTTGDGEVHNQRGRDNEPEPPVSNTRRPPVKDPSNGDFHDRPLDSIKYRPERDEEYEDNSPKNTTSASTSKTSRFRSREAEAVYRVYRELVAMEEWVDNEEEAVYVDPAIKKAMYAYTVLQTRSPAHIRSIEAIDELRKVLVNMHAVLDRQAEVDNLREMALRFETAIEIIEEFRN